jgi:hypothetical protein
MNTNLLHSRLIVASVALGQLLPAAPAWAIAGNDYDPNNVNVSAIAPEEIGCNDFCSKIEQTWRGNWSRYNDQWCADHGSPTNLDVPARQVAYVGGTSEAQSCPYPLLPGESCASVKHQLFSCKWRNSQAAAQCAAYSGMKDASKKEYWVVGFDTAAAATCGVACATQWAAGATIPACQAAGVVATGSEAVASLFMKNQSAVSKYAGIAASTAGAASVAVTLAKGEKVIGGGGNHTMVCAAAVAFTALAGLRYKHIVDAKKGRKESCDKVKELASAAFSFAGGGPGNPDGSGQGTNPLTTVPTAGGTTLGDYNGAGTSGTASLGIQAANEISTAPELPPEVREAVDGQMLTRGALDRQLKDKLAAMDASGFAASLDRNHGPGEAIRGMMNAAGAGGDLGTALANLSRAATENARDFAPLTHGVAGTSYAGGGGGGGREAGAAAGDGAPDLAKLFGQGAAGPQGAAASRSLAFDEKPGDIWHTGTDQNIFQIVTTRIQRVSPRFIIH